MEKKIIRIVNAGLAGEPEHIVFQNIETLEIIELDSINHVYQDGLKRPYKNPEDWQYVLSNMNQQCEYDPDDDVGGTAIYLV